MKKTSVILILLTILIKILGFGREIALSYFYGASEISDAYLISLTIPSTLFAFIGTGIATCYIPIYSDIVAHKNAEHANRFTNNLIMIILIICSIIILIVFTFTTSIVKIFASGFEGEVLNLAVLFTKISILSIYFSGIIFVFNGYLQIKKEFIILTLAGIPLNIITLLSIIISAKYGIIIISIGSALAVAFQLLFLMPFVLNKGFKFSFVFDIKDKYIKKMISFSIPVIIGVSVNQINVLIDRTIASQITEGGISALTYANRINLFIQGLFVLSIATVMYPMITKMAVENNITGYKKTLVETISFINLLVLPSTAGAMVFAEPIVMLLFGRGAFDTNAITITSNALFFYAIGMVGFGLREILTRAFFSLHDTKTPMINSAIAMFMNIILNFILSKYLGIGGLALATSVSAIFCTLLLFFSLRKRIGPFGMKNITISFIKILSASLVMVLLSKLFYDIILNYIDANLSLIFSIGIGVLTYIITIYFMKIEEVNNVVNQLKSKIKIVNN